jgi:hypothetical protein
MSKSFTSLVEGYTLPPPPTPEERIAAALERIAAQLEAASARRERRATEIHRAWIERTMAQELAACGTIYGGFIEKVMAAHPLPEEEKAKWPSVFG